MEKRMLGNTGLEVTVVGFGAMTIGGAFGPVDDSESNRALHVAIDGGVNFIDTSDAYGEGRSENLICQFLKERSDRHDIIIFTKGGNNMATGDRDFTPEYISTALDNSLKRLDVEAIDLYLLHNPNLDNMQAEDSYAVLEKAKDGGKVKNWGVSVNTDAECDYAIEQGKSSVMQMEYNILEQSPADSFARAKAAGVGVISRVPLKRGFLSGRIDETFEFSEGDRRKNMLSPENIRKFQARLNRLQDIAGHLKISPAAAALRFCVSNKDVSCVIPGIRTPEQAAENVACGEPLPPEAMSQLKDL